MSPTVDEVFVGTVTEVVPFGSFVEHPEGSIGLLYGETAEVGAQVTVKVLQVDPEQNRFSLAYA